MGVLKTNLTLQYAQGFCCAAGLALCIYALVVEMEKEHNPNYKPMCDISSQISCSKAFMSRWGRGFGVMEMLFGEAHILNQRNPLLGIFYYCTLLVLGMFSNRLFCAIYLALVVVSNIGSVYLAYILYFKVQALCVICACLYIVNFLLLIMSWWRYKVVKKMRVKKRD